MEVTNITKGARGINAVSGPVLIEAGQTVEVELNEAELKVATATGWFEISGDVSEDGEGGLDRAELKKQAGELGIEFARNVTTEKLKEMIDAKLAE